MINILDAIIIMYILMGAIVGLKRGVIKQAVMTVGMFLVVILSFILKNPLSALMYKTLPFFTLGGLLKNYSALNIIIYELIAFSIVFAMLSTVFILLVRVSSIVERLLKITIILAIPSKILGAILGLFEYYLVVFVILFIMSSPTFKINDIDFINESKIKPVILSKTPFVSKITNDTTKTFDEINDLLKNKNHLSDEKFNCKSLNIMIKNNVLSKDSADYLYSKEKINNKCKVEG